MTCIYVPLELAMGARKKHAAQLWPSCVCRVYNDIVFSPWKRKVLLSLPYTDREPLISTGGCALQASALVIFLHAFFSCLSRVADSCAVFFFRLIQLFLVGNPTKKWWKSLRQRAFSYGQPQWAYAAVSWYSERRVRKPTKKKKKKKNRKTSPTVGIISSSLPQRVLFHRCMLTESPEKRTQKVTVTRTMEHRRQANKKGSPTFLQLYASERTEPHVSRTGDRTTESGLTTQVLLLKSLESKTGEILFLLERRTLSDGLLSIPKDPKKHGGTIFSRILGILGAIWSLDRATAMSEPVWMSIDDAHLASQLQRASTIRWAPTRQGAGVNCDWLACTPDCPRPRSAAPGNASGRYIRCEQADRQCYVIDIEETIRLSPFAKTSSKKLIVLAKKL